MADSVVKLRIDSKEYDANIKRAGQALQDYFNTVRQGGGTLDHLADGVLEAVQSMGTMATAASGSKGQLRELTVALNDMLGQYRSLTDAEQASPLGRALSQSISELTQRAGTLRDAMDDVNATIALEASDTKNFDQVSAAVQGVTTAFQLAQGGAQLLGMEMGDAMDVMAKLQSAMAITSGLQQAQTLLQKESALMYGVQSVQMGMAAAAQSAVATATGSATAAQAAFNAVAKANPYVLLATAVAAVGTALYAFAAHSKKAEEAQAALSKAIDNTRNALQQIDKDTDFSVGVAEAAGKSWEAIHQLRLEAARTKLALADMAYDKLVASGNASKDQIAKAVEMQQNAWDGVMKVLNEGTIHDIQKRNGTGPFAGRGVAGGGTPTKEKDEMALNIEKINSLTSEYIKASDERRTAIEKEIKVLQDRNAEIQQLKDMAQGKSVAGGDIPEITVKASMLPSVKKAFSEAPANFESFNAYISGIQDILRTADLGSDFYNSLMGKLRDATTASTLIQEMMKRGLEGADLEGLSKLLKEKLLSPEGLDHGAVSSFLASVNEDIERQGGVRLTLNRQTGAVESERPKDDKFDDFVKGLSQVTSGLGSVSSGLASLGIEMPKEVNDLINIMSAVGQVISGVQAVISVFATSSQAANTTAVSLNTAAIAANTAALGAGAAVSAGSATAGAAGGAAAGSVAGPVGIGVGLVAGVLLSKFFANGGAIPQFAHGGPTGYAAMIPGNSFSGDNVIIPVDGGRGFVGVNSGEIVLNRAQQGVLADALTAGGGGESVIHPYVYGEQIFLGMNSFAKRTGRGEIVTTGMLRSMKSNR